jgi:hypothetical protein
MPKRPRKKPVARPHGVKRKTKRQNLGTRASSRPLSVSWKNLVPMYDFWGKEFERYYKLETLTNAVEGAIRGQDKFVLPSVHDVLGPAPVTRITGELFQEGRIQLIFRLRAVNANRKRASFALVAAKNHQDYSDIARAEHKNLRILYKRAPQCVVRPYRGSIVFLPDRHRRSSHNREVYVYLTEWLRGFHELGIQRNHQLYVNVANKQTFTPTQSQALKRRMVEIVLRTYDPKGRTCMGLPQLASGDFVVTKPGLGTPKLKLIACREMLQRMSPARLLNEINHAEWEWSGKPYRLAPDSSRDMVQALHNAYGKKEATRWLELYRKAVNAGRFPESRHFTCAELNDVLD